MGMSDEGLEVAPGEFIKKRAEERGWTQVDLAFVLDVTTATVNQIFKGRRGLSPAMAKSIGAALDIEPEVLARMQADLDVRKTDEPESIIRARGRVLSVYPLRDMIKRGWIEESQDHNELELAVSRFFGAKSLDQVPHLSHAAKRTLADDFPPAQLAWLFRVRQIANEMPSSPFSKKKLLSAIDQMKLYLCNQEEVRHVPKLLQGAGVRFLLVESLPGSKIDGVCLWLNAHSPVIGMSMRFDRIDNFWFVLRHECSHVLHGHGRDGAIVDTELDEIDQGDREEERIANEEAADFCVPKDKMDSFYLRKKPFFSDRDVVAFAKISKIHPGLVVGQLHRRLGRYNLLRRHLKPVMEQIEGDAIIDGWGHFVPVG